VPKLNHDDEFKKWVSENTALNSRSVGDICSRARRLVAMVDLASARSLDDLNILLIRSESFNFCTPSVKSQLKKAGALYLEFMAFYKPMD
jgi:hypothetical protein